jgi:hypothetical protein
MRIGEKAVMVSCRYLLEITKKIHKQSQSGQQTFWQECVKPEAEALPLSTLAGYEPTISHAT